MTTLRGPLEGIRIVEFDAIGPLPLAGMLLADMGADVIRVTRPRTGEEPWGDVGGSILHRSRAFVELDLKAAHDKEQALALVARADALIEGLRPGVMERLGLGPHTCLTANPRLVYGRITGWGQAGPLATRAGHDINYIGLTGALYATGRTGIPPPVPLNLVGDYGGGSMFLIAGVLAALFSAKTSGKGQVVDAAIIDGVASTCCLFHAFRASGQWSDHRENNLLDGAAPFYRCYACADGKFVAVGALEPQFYRQFLAGMDVTPDDYPQYDREKWPQMAQKFSEIFARKPRDQWTAIFADTDACVTPVLTWSEAPNHPHHQARSAYVVREGLCQPACAPRFSDTPTAITAPIGLTPADALARWMVDR